MILFLQLLLAHLLGDFVLQPDSWVREKESKTYRSNKLYLHGLVHFFLVLLLTWNTHLFFAALLIALSHVAIDSAKLQFQRQGSKRFFFAADQALHLLVLAVAVIVIEKPAIVLTDAFVRWLLTVATAVVFLLTPSSVIIKLILSKWAPATEIKSDKIETSSLLHAGMMIGFLERILVFIFILAGQWSAIGFLVTAKSVFRFSDLKIGQDRKLTEYILIGTLLSFGIAILTGVLANMLTKGV